MRSGLQTLFGAVALAGLVLGSQEARADAIDGDWCHEGRNLSIRGSNIRTPGNSNIVGQYGRHAFRYIVPDNEPDAGAVVEMDLLNDEEMNLRVAPSGGGAVAGDWQVWRRCKVVS